MKTYFDAAKESLPFESIICNSPRNILLMQEKITRNDEYETLKMKEASEIQMGFGMPTH